MLALKSGLNDGPGLCALVLPGSNAARGVFDDPTASVTLYLWSRLAFLIELEYESHRMPRYREIAGSAIGNPHCAGAQWQIELKHSRTQGLKNAVMARFASRMAWMANDETQRLAICS